MATHRTLRLKRREQRELEHSRDHDARPSARERCSALLQIAAGATPPGVARHGVLRPRDPDTLYGWVQISEEGGVRSDERGTAGGPARRAG
jgi:hypothetical protein